MNPDYNAEMLPAEERKALQAMMNEWRRDARATARDLDMDPASVRAIERA